MVVTPWFLLLMLGAPASAPVFFPPDLPWLEWH